MIQKVNDMNNIILEFQKHGTFRKYTKSYYKNFKTQFQ